MDVNQNRELVRRYFETAFIQHDLKAAEGMLTPDYLLHDPTRPGFDGGPRQWRECQEMYIRAFPDHHLRIMRQLASGDCVTTQWEATGTQKADLPGIPASGKRVTVQGITISRVRDGKVCEEWQVWDFQGFLEQLGAEPIPRLIAA